MLLLLGDYWGNCRIANYLSYRQVSLFITRGQAVALSLQGSPFSFLNFHSVDRGLLTKKLSSPIPLLIPLLIPLHFDNLFLDIHDDS